MMTQQGVILNTPPIDNGPMLNLYIGGSRGRQSRSVANLISLESHQNYTWLLWQNGERNLLPRTLKYLEEKLPAGQFVRLHRHCTINIDYIDRIDRPAYYRMLVWLRTGECIKVARRRIMPVRKQLQTHLIWRLHVMRGLSSAQQID